MTDYYEQGYVVYADKFYTSPALANALTARGVEQVGTLRVNRVDIPASLKDTRHFERNAPRGDMHCALEWNFVHSVGRQTGGANVVYLSRGHRQLDDTA